MVHEGGGSRTAAATRELRRTAGDARSEPSRPVCSRATLRERPTDARWALDLDAEGAESPVGRYAATLALLVLGADAEAGRLAESLQDAGDAFPREVADALRGLGAGDSALYADGLERVLRSFEERDTYLENVPVADTVLVLEILAESRGLAAHPSSPLVP